MDVLELYLGFLSFEYGAVIRVVFRVILFPFSSSYSRHGLFSRPDVTQTILGAFERVTRDKEAVEQFKLIYETDIGYKDVAAKVDAYYAGQ